MDAMSDLQQQLMVQVAAVNSQLAGSSLTDSLRAELVANGATLQAFLDKLLIGGTLTPAEQQTLENSLNSSQKAILAAKAQRTQFIVFGLAGLIGIGILGILIFRHYKKKSSR